MRISDWSSDVCSSDLVPVGLDALRLLALGHTLVARVGEHIGFFSVHQRAGLRHVIDVGRRSHHCVHQARIGVYADVRSEEHTSELQSLMRISYAVFCLKKKRKKTYNTKNK